MPHRANLRFLDAPGEVARLMRGHDWAQSPLGPPEEWPQSLRSVVSLLLRSKFPMFVAWGPSLGFLYNDPYAEILGSKHPDAIGRPFKDVWTEIWSDIRGLVDRALAGEASFMEDLPLTMQRKGYEEPTWFTFSYSPVVDEQGDVAGMYCACTETTTNVLAKHTRTVQIQRLTSLFAQAPGLFAVTRGRDHVFEITNPAYLDFVGREGILGLTVREALPEIDQRFVDQLTEVFDTGVAFIGRRIPVGIKRGDRMEDRIVDFVFQPILDDAGRVDGIFVQGTDITEQAVAELTAQTERSRLDAVIDSLPSGVIIADRSGAIVRTNAANRQIWGEHPMSATISEYGAWQGWWADGGARHGERVHADEWALARALRGELVTGDVAEIQPFDGSPRRTLLLQATPIRLEDGSIAGAVAAQTDISDRMRAEAELRDSERALRETGRRKDEFLAMLAHELRNPLAPISTASQLLLLDPDPARVRSASEVITRQVRHMTALVDDLLDVSRVTRGLVQLEMEAVDLKEVIVGAIEQVRPMIDARKHSLRTRMTAEPLWVRGDQTRLTQVFANILNNAAKYTPEAGDLGVELDTEGTNVVVRIRDSGQGIEAALLPQIFELFTQAERTPDRAQGGLGIGLALVRSLVQLHGGSISAHSEGNGNGATFTVMLPAIQPAPAGEHADGAAAAHRDGGSLDVVVVDDNIDAARTLQGLLEALGHRVRIFHRALDALEAIVAQPPALAFLDIGLPDITGYELAKRIRARLGEHSCVLSALSGYGQPQDIVASRQAGMDHHLIKPLDYAQLRSVLAETGAATTQTREGHAGPLSA